jgi:prophage tail gpP-like protein
MSQLTLFIEGKKTVFVSASLQFAVEQLAHTFSCDIEPMVITTPLPVEFLLDDKRVFIGTIDTVSSNTASSEYAMSLSGRSLSANMIDSKITMDALYDQTLEALLISVSADFGLSVQSFVAPSELSVVEEFQINAESPVDNLSQIAKEQGVLLIERNGVLTIENPAHAALQNVRLEVGKNIESLSIDRNFTKQFYHIEVQGQWNEAHAVVIYAPANTQRKRVIVSDQLQSAKSCEARATYERDLAIAQGLTVSTSIPGLFSELTGSAINRTVNVIDEHQHFNETLLVKSISLSVNDSTAETKVELFRPFKEKPNV